MKQLFALLPLVAALLSGISLRAATDPAGTPGSESGNAALPEDSVRVERIWDRGYSAFPSIVRYKGAMYVSFREGVSHIFDENGIAAGRTRILRSRNGRRWKSVALLSKEGYDLRDPKLSVTPDGNYLNTVAKDFDAQGKTVALTAQSGVQAVNRWVAEKTHDLNTILSVALVLASTTFILKATGSFYMGMQLPAVNNLIVCIGHTLALVLTFILYLLDVHSLLLVVLSVSAPNLFEYDIKIVPRIRACIFSSVTSSARSLKTGSIVRRRASKQSFIGTISYFMPRLLARSSASLTEWSVEYCDGISIPCTFSGPSAATASAQTSAESMPPLNPSTARLWRFLAKYSRSPITSAL